MVFKYSARVRIRYLSTADTMRSTMILYVITAQNENNGSIIKNAKYECCIMHFFSSGDSTIMFPKVDHLHVATILDRVATLNELQWRANIHEMRDGIVST